MSSTTSGAGSVEWMVPIAGSVNAWLETFFAGRREHARAIAPESAELVDAIAELTLRGGKRLRPAVLAATYRAFTGEAPSPAVIAVGGALELLQSYFLIHDDWMDGDETRRGGPAVHMWFRARGADEHRAASLAVLAGDLACAYASQAFDDPAVPRELVAELLRTFTHIHEDVLQGQQLDLVGAGEIEKVYDLKTASYTTRGPMWLGATLARAGRERIPLFELGRALGVGFQLRDDLLGTFGQPDATGKPRGGDLREGKRTALIEASRTRLDEEGRRALARVFGKREATDAEISDAIDALRRAGVEAHVGARIAHFEGQAHAHLDAMLRIRGMDEGALAQLRSLVPLLLDRDR